MFCVCRGQAALLAFLSGFALFNAGLANAQDISRSEQRAQIKKLNDVSGAQLKKSTANKEQSAPREVQVKLKEIRTELLKSGNSKLIGGKPTFVVGDTKVLRRPLKKLAGSKPPANLASRIPGQIGETKKSAEREKALAAVLKAQGLEKETRSLVPVEGSTSSSSVCNPSASRFDWRDHGAVTAVKDQGECGSCWSFAAMAAIEGSYFVRTRDTFVGSEQQILSCSRAGSCEQGGWYSDAWENLQGEGTAPSKSYPYVGQDTPCRSKVATPYHWGYWGWVDENQDVENYSVPTPKAMIKDALCQRGPLATTVAVTEALQAYSGGVFNETTDEFINHAVTIVGWDDADNAWIVKNSWSKDWGENGYIRINYDSNKIGVLTAWVSARKPVQLTDNCTRFDPAKVRLRDISGRWKFVYQGRNIFDLGDRSDDAQKALNAVKFYKINNWCDVGRTVRNAQGAETSAGVFQYFLAGTKTPAGPMPGENCSAFNLGNLDVNQRSGKWALEDGSKKLATFDTQDDAWLSYAYLRRHSFTHQCNIGSFFAYYRK